MALWLNPDPYPADEILDKSDGSATEDYGANAYAPFTDQPDFDGVDGRLPDTTTVLPFVIAVNESIGGQGTPDQLIGWSTGIVPMSLSRGDFDGATIQPAQIDVLYASQQYGDVGLSNRNEVMVQALINQDNVFTPNDANAAMTFVTPGFE
jgi:hypothetical protein